MASNIKLSNVIGAPFSDHVLEQLYIRAARNSTVNRTNEEVLFLANKTSWVRMISSVDITLSPGELKEYYNKLGLGPGYDTPKDLARDWVLEAGTSKQSGNGIQLRTGLGPEGAYGLGGTEELGYRPMPGLTSVVIETTGRLGSLRQATVNFQVWNMTQLNVVEALYFRLGYSMLLEWGHTQYFTNDNSFRTQEIYGIDAPFEVGVRKEDVQQRIAQKARQSSGNYDGMLGIVSNFTWKFNEAGGYDCTVRLVGQGAVMDSLKTNQIYTLPQGTLKEYKKNQSAIEAAIQQAAAKLAKQAADEQARLFASQQPVLEPAPKSRTPLLARLKKYDGYPESKTLVDLETDYGVDMYTTVGSLVQEDSTRTLAYYTLFNNNPNAATRVAAENAYGGLWLDRPGLGFVRLPYSDNNNIIFDTNLFNAATSVAFTSKTAAQGTPVTQYFDDRTAEITSTVAVGVGGVSVNTIKTPLDKPLPEPKVTVTYRFTNIENYRSNNREVYVAVTATINADQNRYFEPTRKQLLEVLENWQNLQTGGALTNVKLTSTKKNEVIVSGTFTQLITATYNGPANLRAGVVAANGSDKKGVEVLFTVETNNPGFILKVLPPTPFSAVTRQGTGVIDDGITNGTVNQANSSQVESTLGFTSALHAMLVIVQTKAQASALNISTAAAVSILDETRRFFEDGSLRGVIDLPSSTVAGPDGLPFDLLKYGQKGFNSSLMYDKTLYNSIPDVDFKKLCRAYAVKYTQGGEEGTTQSVHCPVYITLGYLLAFLNNMCLIYDTTEQTPTSTQRGNKRPYVYIDFNPETNFCLTTPQQMSVDPFTCLIPFNATLEDYKELFPTREIVNKLDPAAFDPQADNVITEALNKTGLEFKATNTYQGKMMNILLNIDYLLGLIRDFAGADAEHAVNLQPFLERILRDVNKNLGNINSFRVGYRDESNTIQLLDDQWVPSYQGIAGGDTSILTEQKYLDKFKTDKILAGVLPLFDTTMPAQLPVAGVFSLAREFQFQTVMSTKLASMIAISAQANTGSVNSKDHSALSHLNRNFTDRYMPFKQDTTAVSVGANVNTTAQNNEKSNDLRAAELFNVHVQSIYSNRDLSVDKLDLARNYYIERMSKVKSTNELTSAAPFIPANLDITIDGISGIIMGNAFTIPEERLPLSLRGQNGKTKVAFIVTGLTHTIEQNEWLTRIKGQMIKLRAEVRIPTAVATITTLQKAVAPPLKPYAGLIGNAIEDAVNFIKQEEGLYSAIPKGYKPVINPTPDTLVYAYKVGPDKITIGYGTTKYTQGLKKGRTVVENDVIRVQEAEAELRAVVAELYRDITNSLTGVVNLSSGQMTALISMAYNAGIGNLKKSEVWTRVRQGADKDIVAQAIRRFANTREADGQILPGLITRREKESQIYIS